MFCLIKSKNNEYSVISTDKIKSRNNRRCIKRAGHDVEVISRSDGESELRQIANNLEKNIPQVLISKIPEHTDKSLLTPIKESNPPELLSIADENFDTELCEYVGTLKLSSHDDSSSKAALNDHDYSRNSDSLNMQNLTNISHISDNEVPNFITPVSSHSSKYITTSDNDDKKQQAQPLSLITSSDETENKLTVDDSHLQPPISDVTLTNDPDINYTSDNTEFTTTESSSIMQNKLNLPLHSESSSRNSNGKIKYPTASSNNLVRPKITSHLVGEFIVNKNGTIHTVHFPNSCELNDLEDIPIMIIDPVASNLNTTEQMAISNSTFVENTNLLAVLENCNFIENKLPVETESSSDNTSQAIESSLFSSEASTVPVSVSDMTVNDLNHDENMEFFHNKSDISDIRSERGSHHDDDSDSNTSYISELEDLDDELEGVDNFGSETVIRDKTSPELNEDNDLSIITEIRDYSRSNNRTNHFDKDQLNDTNLSSLALTDPSRLSSSTLNQSQNDSSYVPTPDLSSNQTNEVLNENSTLENLEDSDDDSTVEELIKKSKPPCITELKVPKAGDETKKSFCCYCFQFFVVISRHFEAMHSDEEDVKNFLALKKRSAARLAAIEKLRLKGTKLFNLNQDFNHGQLLVTRQPQKTSLADAHDFKPCHKCGRWLQYITRHKCPYGKEDGEDRSGLIKSKLMMGQFHENASSLTRKILAINNEDEISEVVRKDPLLVIFVNELSEKYTNPHQHSMIRSRVRMLGNILIKMKKYNKENFKGGRINQKCNAVDIKFFSDIIDPRLYDNFIIAVQSIVGADAEKNQCKAPSTATAAGTWVTKIAKLHEKELIKQLQYKKAKNVEYFIKIHQAEFPTKINCLARNVQIKMKRHKETLLPTMADINKFRDFVESHLVAAYSSLHKGFNFRTWKLLAAMTLIYVLLFNRRRPGELERVTIQDYQSAKNFEETNPEEYARLSAEEKTLVDEYIRFELGGKKGREVPLIISSGMQNFIKKILEYRSAAKVDPNNPHIFGIPGFDGTRYKHLQACVLMRRFSKLCNAEHPERLRATHLRKHFATTVASLKIDECQIYDVSNFMGHAEKIHRAYYRQSVVTRDLCGVSKILEVASGVPSVVKRAPIDPDSKSYHSEASCSSWNNIQDDSLNRPSIPNDVNYKTTENVSSPSCTDEESSESLADARLKEYKNKFQGKKRALDYESSSDEEIKPRKRTLKKGLKKPVRENIDLPEVGLKRNNIKTAWSNEERKLVLSTFDCYIKNMKLPPAASIKRLIANNPVLQKRTEAQVRTYVHNKFARKLRELKQI